jgi:hypothetical protein
MRAALIDAGYLLRRLYYSFFFGSEVELDRRYSFHSISASLGIGVIVSALRRYRVDQCKFSPRRNYLNLRLFNDRHGNILLEYTNS